jgi:hypothetical protein
MSGVTFDGTQLEVAGLETAVAEWFDVSLPMAVREALQIDCKRLLSAARQHCGEPFSERSQALLLLDNLDEKCIELLADLIDGNGLDGFGAGTDGLPIPVIMAVKWESKDDIRRKVAEGRSDQAWLRSIQLEPFNQKTEEDLLAYEYVLLNPFRGTPESMMAKRWVFNRAASPRDWDKGTEYIRKWIKGKPAMFNLDYFEMVVETLEGTGLLVPADDEQDRNLATSQAQP